MSLARRREGKEGTTPNAVSIWNGNIFVLPDLPLFSSEEDGFLLLVCWGNDESCF